MATWSGMAFTAFVTDVFSRRIVGWRTAPSMPTELPLDALGMALWTRARAGQDIDGVVHHSDAGSQYTSIAFSDALIEAGITGSIGSVGDALDNALMESTIGLFKTELIDCHERSWTGRAEVERETASWVHWSRYAGDPLGGRGGRAGRVTASIGDLSCLSFRAFCALPVPVAAS